MASRRPTHVSSQHCHAAGKAIAFDPLLLYIEVMFLSFSSIYKLPFLIICFYPTERFFYPVDPYILYDILFRGNSALPHNYMALHKHTLPVIFITLTHISLFIHIIILPFIQNNGSIPFHKYRIIV